MHVRLDNLRPEMVLAADLTDSTGRLLLSSGTALTEKHVRYCQMWGIGGAEITGQPEAPETGDRAVDPAVAALVEQAVRLRFAPVDLEHPAMAALFRHCVATEIRKRA